MLAPEGSATLRNGCAWFFDHQLDFRERFSFGGHQRGNDGALGHRGQQAAVGKASPLQRKSGLFVGRAYENEMRLAAKSAPKNEGIAVP